MLLPYRKSILIVFFLCCQVFQVLASGETATDSLMKQLDNIISNREIYLSRKKAELDSLHRRFDLSKDDVERFNSLNSLYDAYNAFNVDSAYSISQKQEAIAKRIGDSNLVIHARMNKANILGKTGMYHETIELMDSIRFSDLPGYLRPYYYHIKRTVSGLLEDYSAFEEEKKYYHDLTNSYRDSIMSVNPVGSLAYVITKTDYLNVNGQPGEALKEMEAFISSSQLTEHEIAICACTLAESYSLIGDREKQKEQLMISSIADMKASVREYISLRQLALLLYSEGDLERAYRFLSIAIDDATKCNARQRIIELNAHYPMINDIYVGEIQSQKKTLSWTIVIITVLTVFLFVLLLYTRKQMRKVAEARKAIQEAYEKLNGLNAELHKSNDRLQEANRDIAEISELKEVYIGRYMDQCLEYIDKLDSYRKQLGKLCNSGKEEELKKVLKSTTVIDEELKEFYNQFDKTFLSLFPTFVEDFNKLLMPEEVIIPKKKGCLNTELRIFALIRLGITDSDNIAKFLRYSLTTIYNYRTKVRNKAKGDRNLLEQEVVKIGRS